MMSICFTKPSWHPGPPSPQGGPPAELAHTAAPQPAGPAPAGPGAVRAGGARARIREAPAQAAGPVPAAPALRARGPDTTAPARTAAQAEAHAAELARVAAVTGPWLLPGMRRRIGQPGVRDRYRGAPGRAAGPVGLTRDAGRDPGELGRVGLRLRGG